MGRPARSKRFIRQFRVRVTGGVGDIMGAPCSKELPRRGAWRSPVDRDPRPALGQVDGRNRPVLMGGPHGTVGDAAPDPPPGRPRSGAIPAAHTRTALGRDIRIL